MIENKGKFLLPGIYINQSSAIPKTACNGKIKVSVRKFTSTFGLSSDVSKQISQYTDKTSSWSILSPEEEFLFTIVYWKKR